MRGSSSSCATAHSTQGRCLVLDCRRQRRVVQVQAVLKLSVLPVPRAALPLHHGSIAVAEPKYLALMADLQRQQLEHPGSKMCFGHLISPSTAPPALLAGEESIQGPGGPWPRVGCIATITSVHPQDDGSLKIGYELSRRFTLLRVDRDEPYPVAYAMHYADVSEGLSPGERQEVDDLEQQVYRSLLETESLSQQLQEGAPSASLSVLPRSISKYAPPPPQPRRSFAQALTDAGYAAGYDMYMWQRQRGAYGVGSSSRGSSGDPYSHVSEKLNKEQRQELFSFAAASLVDGMGNVECLALLHSQDTAARLQWVLQAISPYLMELQAKVSVMKALSSGR